MTESEAGSTPERGGWPNLIIAGTQKAGTTWLHRAFAAHPAFAMSDPKELYFFGHADVDDPERQAWYRSHFTDRQVRFRGEATSNYFWHRVGGDWSPSPEPATDAASGIARLIGPDDVHVFVLLRSPVARAVAGANHHLTMERLEPDSDLFAANPDLGIIDLGFYGRHLGHYLDTLGPATVHPLFFDDLSTDAAGFLDQALGFLGLDVAPIGDDALAEVLTPAHTRAAMRSHRQREHVPPFQVHRATIERLVEIYRSDVGVLAGLVDRDLAHWLDVDALAERLVTAR